MNEKGVASMRKSADSIEHQPRDVARWPRGGYVWILLVVCFVWFRSGVDRAEAEPARVEVGAKVAPSLEQYVGARENSDAVNAYKWGVSFGAGLRLGVLSDWLSVQTEVLYATRGTDVDLMENTGGSFNFTYLELPLLVRLRIPFRDGVVRPSWSGYAVLGPSVSILLDAENEDGAGATRSLDRDVLNGFDVGVVAGLGMAWEVAPEWALSLEARFDQGFIDAFKAAETKNQAFLLTLGIDFTLGHGDSDGDRLADYLDRCRTQAADPDQDRDGCPDEVEPRVADKDGDGMIDEKDQCPVEAEDVNEYKDADGCPDGHLDDDQDGLVNGQDQCQEEHFSLDTNLEYSSVQDNEPEQKEPGCRILRVTDRRLVLDPPVQFEPAQVDVQAPQAWILDEVAQYLRANPGVVLDVEGFADRDVSGAESNAERINERVSRNRANNVISYLTKKGISPKQLKLKVGGGTDLSTEEGKRMSRSVEFTISGDQ
jgi:outer membrane protein OmpA-like peptidoglycan-associated protein